MNKLPIDLIFFVSLPTFMNKGLLIKNLFSIIILAKFMNILDAVNWDLLDFTITSFFYFYIQLILKRIELYCIGARYVRDLLRLWRYGIHVQYFVHFKAYKERLPSVPKIVKEEPSAIPQSHFFCPVDEILKSPSVTKLGSYPLTKREYLT